MRAVTRLALLALACGACAGIYVKDVEREFARDEARLVARAPTPGDPSPARAAEPETPFAETERVARAYLAERPGADDDNSRYVRSLLACALLARGRTAEARDAIAGIAARHEGELTPRNAVVLAVSHAVGACRAVDARVALLASFEDPSRVRAFIEEYGSFVRLGSSARNPHYEAEVERAVATVRQVCFSESEEQRAYHRGEMRRLIGEQLSDEAAALLTLLPEPGETAIGAPERWLATVAVGCLVLQGWLMEDMLPFDLSDEEKIRRREETGSLFLHGRRVAGHFLDEAARAAIEGEGGPGAGSGREHAFRDLYDRLLKAAVQVEGWIETR